MRHALTVIIVVCAMMPLSLATGGADDCGSGRDATTQDPIIMTGSCDGHLFISDADYYLIPIHAGQLLSLATNADQPVFACLGMPAPDDACSGDFKSSSLNEKIAIAAGNATIWIFAYNESQAADYRLTATIRNPVERIDGTLLVTHPGPKISELRPSETSGVDGAWLTLGEPTGAADVLSMNYNPTLTSGASGLHVDLYRGTTAVGTCDMSDWWEFCHTPPQVTRAFVTTDGPAAAGSFTLTRYA